jgi:glycosyltransferase involved in cell wall biosynthesis
MKKTILYLRTDIHNTELIAGGSVTHTTGVIQGFLAHGYTIKCASSCMIKTLKSIKQIKSIKELRNPPFFSFFRWKLNSFLSSFFFATQILRSIKKNEVSFIYQRYSILNCTGVLISSIKNVPLILEYNGSEAWIDKNWTKKAYINFRWLIDAVEILNIKRADYIVVVSAVLKEELITRGINPAKILINPNGVDTDSYDPEILKESRMQVRKELNIENKFVFGFVGTFSIWHGINVLAEMIPEIIKQCTNAHFILIGDGPLCISLKESLKNCIQHVTFTGLLPAQKAKDYLAACDAFLSPTQPNDDGSRFFGSPTKMFEYMSLAKPILASDLEQLAELIEPAVRINDLQDYDKYLKAQGFLIDPKNRQGFIKAAQKIIEIDVIKRNTIGINVRNKTINEYSWKKHVEKIITFIGH